MKGTYSHVHSVESQILMKANKAIELIHNEYDDIAKTIHEKMIDIVRILDPLTDEDCNPLPYVSPKLVEDLREIHDFFYDYLDELEYSREDVIATTEAVKEAEYERYKKVRQLM